MAKLKDSRVYGNLTIDNVLTVTQDTTIAGNLVVNGTTTTVNSVTTTIVDPIVEQGGGANGALLTGNDGKDRGTLFHYYTGANGSGTATDAFMGWDNSNGEFSFGSNVTVSGDVVTFNTAGNVRAGVYFGNAAGLTAIPGANVTGVVATANYAYYAGDVINASQGNITSLGTLSGLNVSGISNVSTINSNGVVTVTNATTSTSSGSGALVVTGGTGIGGNLYVGGTIYGNISGSTSSPGQNTQVVFNDAGTSNASAGMTFDKTTNAFSVTGTITGGNLSTGGSIVGANVTSNGFVAASSYVTVGSYLTTNTYANIGTNLEVGTTANIAGNVKVDNLNANGTVEANTIISRDLASTRVPFANTDKSLTSSSQFTFDSTAGRLSVQNANVAAEVAANTIKSRDLTSTRVPFIGASNAFVDSGNLTFTDNEGKLTAVKFAGTGEIESGNIKANNLTATKLVVADTGGRLIDSGVTFNNDTLTTNNVVASTSLIAGNVRSNALTSGKVVLAGTDGVLVNNANITYSGDSLGAGNITLTGAVVAETLRANTLTTGRVTFAGVDDVLTDDANLTFTGGNTLTVTGNVAATNILTDNLRYANGVAWDLQQAAGSNGQIQFNDGFNNFTASGNLSFNTTGNVLTTDGLQLNGDANVANATVRGLTSGRVTLAGSGGKLEDSSKLTFDGNALAVNGNISMSGAANITGANYFSATTANVTTLNASGSANVGVDLTVSGNANITGTLKAGDTTIAGNLTVTGTTTSVNTVVTQLTDPLFELGGGANGAALTTDDGMDRGLLMHRYANGAAVDSFIGFDNSNAEFVLASNVTVIDNVVTYNTLGDLRMRNIYANNANFGGTVFSNGNITLGAGSFVNGNVNGNISGTIVVSGGAGAIQFANATNALSSSANLNFVDTTATLTVGNGTTTGTVNAANIGGTLTTAAQPNITSVGNLTNLTVDGNVVANVFKSDNYQYANGAPIDFQTAAGNAFEVQFKANGSNDLATSTNFTFNSDTNILTVTGNISASNANLGNVVTANFVGGTLTTAAQPNITSVGILTSVDVTNAANVGSLAAVGNVSGNNGSFTNNLSAANVSITSGLTTDHIVFTGASGKLIGNDNLKFTPGTNTFATINTDASGNAVAGNVIANNLSTAGRIVLSGTAGKLVDNANLSYNTGTDTFNTVNVTATGNISAAQLSGNGIAISNIAGANVSGIVANANYAAYAGNVTASAQANITSLGTLTSLTVNGLTNLGPVGNITISGGTNGQYLQTDGAGNISWSDLDTGQLANGTSNVIVYQNSNIALSVNNTANVVVVTGTGANVTGTIDVSGNINGNNLNAANLVTALANVDANSAITGTIKATGGISATGNIYTGKAVGFAVGGGNTSSAAYIQFNSTANSLDFIFN